MSTRHRYVPGERGLCTVVWSGSACALPEASGYHYSDEDHPFTSNPQHPEECGWLMQRNPDELCTLAANAEAHQFRGDGVTMVMQYPVAEPPVEVPVITPYWKQGNVYPPSDDGGVPTEKLELEAQQYRWTTGGAVPAKEPEPMQMPPVNTGDPQPEWSRAIEWLRAPGVGLTYGPWPMRKFILPDLGSGQRAGALTDTDYGAYEAAMVALDALEVDYCLTVRRVPGAAWREAWLTWDWAYGYTVEVACDELAAHYG